MLLGRFAIVDGQVGHGEAMGDARAKLDRVRCPRLFERGGEPCRHFGRVLSIELGHADIDPCSLLLRHHPGCSGRCQKAAAVKGRRGDDVIRKGARGTDREAAAHAVSSARALVRVLDSDRPARNSRNVAVSRIALSSVTALTIFIRRSISAPPENTVFGSNGANAADRQNMFGKST